MAQAIEVRPLEDYKVDRLRVEVWWHMELGSTNRSRAWPQVILESLQNVYFKRKYTDSKFLY